MYTAQLEGKLPDHRSIASRWKQPICYSLSREEVNEALKKIRTVNPEDDKVISWAYFKFSKGKLEIETRRDGNHLEVSVPTDLEVECKFRVNIRLVQILVRELKSNKITIHAKEGVVENHAIRIEGDILSEEDGTNPIVAYIAPMSMSVPETL
jgi:hypothetical protein